MTEPLIYLDNNATTQPTRAVVDAMLVYLRECFFNASSSSAAFTGADIPRQSAAAQMRALLNAEDAECFTFTSGATESNNWALASLEAQNAQGPVILSTVEHSSISEPALHLSRRGIPVTEVEVDAEGVIRLDSLRKALKPATAFVSIIAANNETGVLQPIQAIGQMVRERSPRALFHTDATQAIGKIPIDLQSEWGNVDLLSFSAHKFHGPKGIGGLYIRPGCEIPPLLLGGGQEKGLRSGTTNTAGLAGVAAAARDLFKSSPQTTSQLRNDFEQSLCARFPAVQIHSRNAARLPNTSCFSIPGIIGDEVAETLAAKNIIVGTGSACSDGAMHPPKTLLAMKVDYELAKAALRVSICASTTLDQLQILLDCLGGILTPSHSLAR
jgi:cysteine desulfurase